MIYALIKNGVVVNTIVLNPNNAHDFPNAVPTDGLPVTIGDTHENGKFYRGGVEVGLEPEPEEPDIDYDDELTDALAALETLGYTA